jgi:hypothetical protein
MEVLHHRKGHAEEDDFGDSVPRWTNVQMSCVGKNETGGSPINRDE